MTKLNTYTETEYKTLINLIIADTDLTRHAQTNLSPSGIVAANNALIAKLTANNTLIAKLMVDMHSVSVSDITAISPNPVAAGVNGFSVADLAIVATVLANNAKRLEDDNDFSSTTEMHKHYKIKADIQRDLANRFMTSVEAENKISFSMDMRPRRLVLKPNTN